MAKVTISNPFEGFNYVVAYYLEQDPTPAPETDEWSGLALLCNPTNKQTTLVSIRIEYQQEEVWVAVSPIYFGECGEDDRYCWAGPSIPELKVLPEPEPLGEFAKKTLGIKEV